MSWDYKFDERALAEFKRLGHPDQIRVKRYLDSRLTEDPRQFGSPLRHQFAGLWRYRVGDIRLICELKDEIFIVLVLRVGHRRDVYD